MCRTRVHDRTRVGLADRDYMKAESWQREQRGRFAACQRRMWRRWHGVRLALVAVLAAAVVAVAVVPASSRATPTSAAVAGPVASCVVPTLRERTLVEAKVSLARASCVLGRVSRAYSALIASGRVISLRPAAGARRAAGTKVDLLVSRGRPSGMLVLSCSGCAEASSPSSDVFTLTAAGGRLRRVPSIDGLGAVWSPDRRWLAYARAGRLWRSPARGTATLALTAPPRGARDGQPAWSPDGRWILFTRSSAAAGRESRATLWRVPARGGPARLLVRERARDVSNPSWSPDGKRIVYAAGRGEDLRLWVARADGSGRRPLGRPQLHGSLARWSPDGKSIAVHGPNRLRVLDLRTGRTRSYAWLSWDDDDGGGRVGDFAWSPEGAFLAYVVETHSWCDALPDNYVCEGLQIVLVRLLDGEATTVYELAPSDRLVESGGLDWR